MNPRKRKMLRQLALKSRDNCLQEEVVIETAAVVEQAPLPEPKRKRRTYKRRKNATTEVQDA